LLVPEAFRLRTVTSWAFEHGSFFSSQRSHFPNRSLSVKEHYGH
jgi:hypothetical protein